MVAGQASACLHTTALLQAYQANLLKELDDRGKEVSDIVAELRWATDLLLQATNETARADLLLFGRSFHPALSRSVWMLRWLRCDSRASTYCITLTIV